MMECKYTLGADFSITTPNLGDGELREIIFSHPDVVLKIYAPVERQTFHLRLEKISSFSFSTDHPQNVLEGIRVRPNRGSIRGIPGVEFGQIAAGPQEGIEITLEPIAGPTLVSVCRGLSVFSEQ